ncbi:MAG: PqqD family protein [Myxococcota bacterium]
MWKQYIAQNPDTPARTIEGEAIVITPHDSTLHTLNPTATYIWDRADGSRTLEAIATEMLDEFDVDAETLKVDALAFASEAVAKGLLITSNEPMEP